MFESTILQILQNDAELSSYVTTYAGQSAIFSEFAPEGATKPYITFRIDRRSSDHPAIAEFSLYTDYWDYGTSRVNARKASERMEILLDKRYFEHERYSRIRVSFFSGGMVDEDDPLVIHYNQQFSVRACRKKWIDELERSV